MKNDQKGIANVILIGAVFLLIAVGGYFVVTQKSEPITEEIVNNQTQYSELEIIPNLKSNWQAIQALVPFRPGHPGTLAWSNPDAVQFFGNDNLLIRFEDGYMSVTAVLNFSNDQFKILETFKNHGEFTFSDWQSLVKKYSDSSYPVSTYTIGLVRNKEILSFPELTKVPENVFVKNYWETSSNTNVSTLVKIYSHGGLCVAGSECQAATTIESDGKVTTDGKLVKTLSKTEVENLVAKINATNFKAIESTKFTGTCPIAYDGPEMVYTFNVAGSAHVLASCKVVIDNNSEPFVSIHKLISN